MYHEGGKHGNEVCTLIKTYTDIIGSNKNLRNFADNYTNQNKNMQWSS